MASGSSRQRSRRQRSRNVEPDEPVIVSDCIDLTTDTSTDDIIDMTQGHNTGLMDFPIVVLTPTDYVGPTRHRRGSGRRGRRRLRMHRNERNDGGGGGRVDWSSTPTPAYVYLTDESDNDLPNPTDEPQQGSSSNNSILQSPEGVKITCPICMDDVRQIQRSQRSLMSTTCGHIFCNVCIDTAILTQRVCPTCRKRLTLRSIHPLFV